MAGVRLTDGRILELTVPRAPDKEPTEDLVVRILVRSRLRRAEICGLAVTGTDGHSDDMTSVEVVSSCGCAGMPAPKAPTLRTIRSPQT